MKVKVMKAEVISGISQKTNDFYESTKVTVIFPDGATAYSGFVPSDVCKPGTIEKGAIYDMYRDEKGYILVFELLSNAATNVATNAAQSAAQTAAHPSTPTSTPSGSAGSHK